MKPRHWTDKTLNKLIYTQRAKGNYIQKWDPCKQRLAKHRLSIKRL